MSKIQTTGSIYLVRHGETIWNTQARKQGIKDSPLTKKGLKQIDSISKFLSQFHITQVFSSPLKRCLITSNIICQQLKTHPIKNKFLKECSFGQCEGMTNDEISDIYPDILTKKHHHPWSFKWPKGESYCDTSLRSKTFINSFLSSYQSDNIAIIAHSMINKTIIGHLLNFTPQQTLQIDHPSDVVYQVHHQQLKYYQVNTNQDWQPGYLIKLKPST